MWRRLAGLALGSVAFGALPAQSASLPVISFEVLDNNRLFEPGQATVFEDDLHWYLRCADRQEKRPDRVVKCRDYQARAARDGEFVPDLRRGPVLEEYRTRYDKAESAYVPGYVGDPKRVLRFKPRGDAAVAARERGATCNWTLRDAAGKTLRAASGCTSVDFEIDYKLDKADVFGFRGLVDLRITQDWSLPQSFTSSVFSRDYLLLAMGDSFTAGEGNPEKNRVPGVPAQWLDYRCHRSVFSYPVILAHKLAIADPRHSVTLLHFGCSGARTTVGMRKAYSGVVDQRGIALLWKQASEAKSPALRFPETWRRYGSQTVPPQIEQARKHLTVGRGQTRRPDLLVMSVGVNDIGLEPFLKALATWRYSDDSLDTYFARSGRDCQLGEQQPKASETDDDAKRRLSLSFNCLDKRLAVLKSDIDEQIKPRRVFMMEYHNPLGDRDPRDSTKSVVCGALPGHKRLLDDFLADARWWQKIGPHVPGIRAGELSREELDFAHRKFYVPLVETLDRSAAANGWEYVESRGDEQRRGFCAQRSWYHTYRASRARQGLQPGDRVVTTGTLHPNTYGQYYSSMRALVQLADEKLFPDHNISCLDKPQIAHRGTEANPDGTRGFAWYIWNKDEPPEKLADKYHVFLNGDEQCQRLIAEKRGGAKPVKTARP
ncbi:MAG: hypothetical protein ACK4MF_03440 [Hyphomicrobiaceae bacterium]